MQGLYLEELVRKALAEDIGAADVTTSLLISAECQCTAHLIAHERLVVSGTGAAELVFRLLDPSVRFDLKEADGTTVKPDGQIAVISGDAAPILSGERVALNFVQRMSGIATLTRRYVEQVEGLPVRIADTRKTTPGLRILEKQAVRAGGGVNHRMGLYDGILIKENHLATLGANGIEQAIERAHRGARHLVKVEVEVGSADAAEAAMRAGADAILLDNMPVAEMREAVKRVRSYSGHVIIEASGSVALDNVREIAETGVDIISVGKLTHSAPAVDISLEIVKCR
jgi:nicotinate-nucleotide pyrophosphorylase (carboxylating)